MPCYRCERRQTDPGRGASAWKRGVARGEQVLVCPQCQGEHDWSADLDRCATCDSTRLVRTLGETRCLACDAVGEAAGGPVTPLAAPAQPPRGDLADDVSAALRRVFGPPPA